MAPTITRSCCFLDKLLQVLKSDSTKSYAVVMDNVAFHRHQLVRDWFNQQNLLQVFLPPYSPMLNPIEEAFSKVHNSLCSSRSTTGPQLSRAVPDAFDSITETDCRGWFRQTIAYHSQCWQRRKIYTAAEPGCMPFEVVGDEEDPSHDDDEQDELVMLR